MSLIKRVLVAFDGSKGSMDALRQGIDLKKEGLKIELTVVHVVKADPDPAFLTVAAVPPDLQRGEMIREFNKREIIKQGEQTVNHARKVLNQERVDAQNIILEGEPAKQICDHAQEKEFDLIIIGNQGLNKLDKMVQGSVSQRVSQHSNCSILVVK
ncbi:universal stress protein [Pseudalkalibacillus sp. A8]|uniref:universal stress protein n=1 Tax=Pseudalkalibacillus sp. A8 TaxID=3382641 RepID=UPI0038B6361D